MSHQGYHEPVEQLSAKTRDRHRAIASLMEEPETADWYNRRVDACNDTGLEAILALTRSCVTTFHRQEDYS